MNFSAIRIHPEDNTATMLADTRKGDTVAAACGGGTAFLTALDDIPFAHKIALRDIAEGEGVIKHGEEIGRATAAIAAGSHVHVHNVESRRGRGDMEISPDPGTRHEAAPLAPAGAMSLAKPALDVRGMTFPGYPRKDGSAGTRNYVGVISTVACANDVVQRLSGIPHTAIFTHQQGCSQTKPDVKCVEKVLLNMAFNPNLGAVIYISLGCESVNSKAVVEEAAARSGKPVRLFVIQEEGGAQKTAERAGGEARRLWDEIKTDPVPVPISKLRVGLKCGSSDTTQAISANLAIGSLTDIFVNAGARVVIGETTEFMGAEHIAARRAVNPETARAIFGLVAAMERRALSMGVDMRGGQPTRGNIAGGLTTIEEKSLGALAKAGSAVFQAVTPYGEISKAPGLTMMDSPGREPELLTGLAAAGCNLVLFATGRGAPQGFPFMPVIKITGNERTWRLMREHMDLCAVPLISGTETPEALAVRFFCEVMEYAGGRPTAAETTGYTNSMNIYVTGPVI